MASSGLKNVISMEEPFSQKSMLLIEPVPVKLRGLGTEKINSSGTNVASKKVCDLPTAYLGEKA
jgi:hypothetical protein